MVRGIQGSGGSVQNVIRVLERVIYRRRTRVWERGIKPLLGGGVGARGRRSAIEILEGHAVLVLVVRQYMMVAAPASRPRERSLTQSRPNRTCGPSDFVHRIPRGRAGLPGYPPPFSFLCFPFAKSLQATRLLCASRERRRMSEGTKTCKCPTHLFDPFGLCLVWRVFIGIVILVALSGFSRVVHHAPFALVDA